MFIIDYVGTIILYWYNFLQMRDQLRESGVQIRSVTLQSSFFASVSLTFEAILLSPPAEQLAALTEFNNRLSSPLFMFGDYQVREGNRGSMGITAAGKTTYKYLRGTITLICCGIIDVQYYFEIECGINTIMGGWDLYFIL